PVRAGTLRNVVRRRGARRACGVLSGNCAKAGSGARAEAGAGYTGEWPRYLTAAVRRLPQLPSLSRRAELCQQRIGIHLTTLHREDPEPPRRAVELLAQLRKIDGTRETLAGEMLHAATAPHDWQVNAQHPLLRRKVQYQLARRQPQTLRHLVFRAKCTLPIRCYPLQRRFIQFGRRYLEYPLVQLAPAQVGEQRPDVPTPVSFQRNQQTFVRERRQRCSLQ